MNWSKSISASSAALPRRSTEVSARAVARLATFRMADRAGFAFFAAVSRTDVSGTLVLIIPAWTSTFPLLSGRLITVPTVPRDVMSTVSPTFSGLGST